MSDKQLVVSTSTQVFLEFACIKPSPQLVIELVIESMIIVEESKHIHRKKDFQMKSMVTHPHSLALTFPSCISVDESMKY